MHGDWRQWCLYGMDEDAISRERGKEEEKNILLAKHFEHDISDHLANIIFEYLCDQSPYRR